MTGCFSAVAASEDLASKYETVVLQQVILAAVYLRDMRIYSLELATAPQ